MLSCRFGETARFDCRSYCRHSHNSVKPIIFSQFFSSFELGGITKHLRVILCKIRVISKGRDHGTSPIWLKICMQFWFGVLTTKMDV